MPRRARVRRRVLVHLSAGVTAIVFALGAYEFIRHDRLRADAFREAAHSPAAAAERIAEIFGSRTGICHPLSARDDLDNLVSGLFALERFGVSPFEAALESWIARASLWLRLPPPDLSYGPGQIRLSRAIALMDDDTAAAPIKPTSNAHRRRAASRAEIAVALLDACFARAVARQLIEMALRSNPGPASARNVLDREQIVELAGVYNAQVKPADAKAALAHQLFNRIAYHLTVHYRYQGARSDLPQRTQSSIRPGTEATADVMSAIDNPAAGKRR